MSATRKGVRAVLSAVVLAFGFAGADAEEPRVYAERYVGFSALEIHHCGETPAVGIVCIPIQATDTQVDVVIDDDIAQSVMGIPSVHYADGRPARYFPRFCNQALVDLLTEPDEQPTYLMVSIQIHGVAGCDLPAITVPTAGTVTATIA